MLALIAAGCGGGEGAGADSAASGRELAERYCQSCHLLPEPDLLERDAWERWVLPRMARRLGLEVVVWPGDEEPLEGGDAGRLVREAGIFPETPLLSRAEWERLASYYLEGAPDSLPPAPPRPPLREGVPGFRTRIPEFRIASPMVTLVHIDSLTGRTYVGDATPGQSTLSVLDGQGRVIETLPLASPAAHLRVSGDTLFLLLMGRLHPSDAPLGSLEVLAPPREGQGRETVWRIDGLRRPVHASYADLTGNGEIEVVVSEFGHLTGLLTWYERLPEGGSRRHILNPAPGALNTFIGDFDGSGRLDVVALTAQGDEGVLLFRGLPGGGFSREWLLRFPPAYGSTSMDLVDVNRDGHLDIVHTSGDLGDYPGQPRPYHGVRIFLNDGNWRFSERFFFPLHGAFKAVARDFDGDGDVDIAAIAFYPDYTSETPESFVYLENLGGMEFAPTTFAGADRGRWLTLDAADLDGDGDLDIVLGSFAQLDALGDQHGISTRWRDTDAPTIVILENTTGVVTARSPEGTSSPPAVGTVAREGSNPQGERAGLTDRPGWSWVIPLAVLVGALLTLRIRAGVGIPLHDTSGRIVEQTSRSAGGRPVGLHFRPRRGMIRLRTTGLFVGRAAWPGSSGVRRCNDSPRKSGG